MHGILRNNCVKYLLKNLQQELCMPASRALASDDKTIIRPSEEGFDTLTLSDTPRIVIRVETLAIKNLLNQNSQYSQYSDSAQLMIFVLEYINHVVQNKYPYFLVTVTEALDSINSISVKNGFKTFKFDDESQNADDFELNYGEIRKDIISILTNTIREVANNTSFIEDFKYKSINNELWKGFIELRSKHSKVELIESRLEELNTELSQYMLDSEFLSTECYNVQRRAVFFYTYFCSPIYVFSPKVAPAIIQSVVKACSQVVHNAEAYGELFYASNPVINHSEQRPSHIKFTEEFIRTNYSNEIDAMSDEIIQGIRSIDHNYMIIVMEIESMVVNRFLEGFSRGHSRANDRTYKASRSQMTLNEFM